MWAIPAKHSKHSMEDSSLESLKSDYRHTHYAYDIRCPIFCFKVIKQQPCFITAKLSGNFSHKGLRIFSVIFFCCCLLSTNVSQIESGRVRPLFSELCLFAMANAVFFSLLLCLFLGPSNRFCVQPTVASFFYCTFSLDLASEAHKKQGT